MGWSWRIKSKKIYGKEAVEFAYALKPEFWHQDFATEIARAAIEIAFDILCYDEIFGFVLPNNISSQRVMQKVGLTYLCDSRYLEMPC